MANSVKILNSGTSGNVPSTLAHGELAINYADGVLYYKDSGNTIKALARNETRVVGAGLTADRNTINSSSLDGGGLSQWITMHTTPSSGSPDYHLGPFNRSYGSKLAVRLMLVINQDAAGSVANYVTRVRRLTGTGPNTYSTLDGFPASGMADPPSVGVNDPGANYSNNAGELFLNGSGDSVIELQPNNSAVFNASHIETDTTVSGPQYYQIQIITSNDDTGGTPDNYTKQYVEGVFLFIEFP